MVPLSARSGVLEWVNNTVPIGSWLDKAHGKYHPQEWKTAQCREALHNEQTRPGATVATKLAVFEKLCKNYTPSLRHFFFENFVNPKAWLTKRTSYIRSVAASSIVGHILAIGDRHVFNILLDVQTAEVIHIDLGMAFNQGQLLAMPERVPFRLTREIVDGMGVTGVEGTFRRCCEETLKVLQSDQEIIQTILDVLRHDPLHSWAVSPKRTRNQTSLENNDDISKRGKSSDSNRHAERALLGVNSRLQSLLNVECTVNELIESATSHENLCQMFSGWQPWA